MTLVQCNPFIYPGLHRHFGGIDVLAGMAGLNEPAQLYTSLLEAATKGRGESPTVMPIAQTMDVFAAGIDAAVAMRSLGQGWHHSESPCGVGVRFGSGFKPCVSMSCFHAAVAVAALEMATRTLLPISLASMALRSTFASSSMMTARASLISGFLATIPSIKSSVWVSRISCASPENDRSSRSTASLLADCFFLSASFCNFFTSGARMRSLSAT